MDTSETAVAPVEPDWNLIQARYLAGEELGTIAEDCGTTARAISQRAWRYHWKAQQFKLLAERRREVEEEVRGCITVSVLREARVFQREDIPINAIERDALSRTRDRLLATASRLFRWDEDKLEGAKRVNVLDV